MNKQLLTLAFVAALMPAMTLDAQVKLEQKWIQTETNRLNDGWPGIPNIGTMPDKNCARFGTGFGGKIYTIDLNQQALVAMDGTNVLTIAQLPASNLSFGDDANGRDYYGTAISHDDAGNFLIGHRFTQPQSYNVWSVFNPTSGDIAHFTLPVTIPARLDCVGRVVGDMTKKGVVYIAPSGNGEASVYMAKFEGDGSIASIKATATQSSPLSVNEGTVGIAQPFFSTVEETLAAQVPQNAFLFTPSAKQPVYFFDAGVEFSFPVTSNIGVNGFDSFVLDGKRYIVRNYHNSDYTPWTNVPSVGVFDETGKLLASWVVPQNSDETFRFFSSAGYSSINAEVIDDTTANIYVYCSTGNYPVQDPNVGGACGVMLTMTVTKPAYTGTGTEDDPYCLYNPMDICAMKDLVSQEHPTYFRLENDIDMSGINYIPAVGAANNNRDFGKTIHFDGNYHVISNITSKADPQGFYYASLFGLFDGSVKNLGIENCDFYSELGAGVLGAYLGYDGKPCVIDNVWATGKVECATAYAGGFGGNSAGPVTIKNSYTRVDVTGVNFAGGVIGRVRADITLNNVYAAGSVKAATAGGLIGTSGNGNSYNVTLTDVVAWNPSVDGSAEASATSVIAATETNVSTSNMMTINGVANSTGVSPSDLAATISGWEAFSEKTYNGMPALKWQIDNPNGGVEGIVVDGGADTDAAPVYYNLQGVRVENPGAGLYIVKRGNKVTKEIIR